MPTKAKQYTIQQVPGSVGRALRRIPRERDLSLNPVILHALDVEAGVSVNRRAHLDLDEFFGSWVSDPKVERALLEQRELNTRDSDFDRLPQLPRA